MSTETDERVEIDVDLEKEVPCETSQYDCQEAAVVRSVVRPCGHSRALCATHEARVKHRVSTLLLPRCHDGGAPHELERVDWIPL